MSDNELKEFCLEFREGILDGDSPEMMCFAVSAPLQAILYHIYELKPRLVEGGIKIGKYEVNHFWLAFPDGRILDATADQFNESLNKQMPKVYLGEKPEWYLL